MAHRTVNLVLALAGLVIVAAIVILGYDAWKVARTGPRWRRRLVAAALMLLAAIGLPTSGGEAAPPDAPKRAAPDASADWQAIHDAWAAALPLAKSGKSTGAERKAADQKMEAAGDAAKRLVAKGLLASQEADLLAFKLASIRNDIYRNPPTDFRGTCYDMAYIPPAQQSLQRLNQRLPLVEKLLEGGKVNPTAGGKIVAGIQADLAILNDAKNIEQLRGEERAKAAEARDKAAQALQRLRKLIPPAPTCYAPMPPPKLKPKSQSYLKERLDRIAALEREGRLSPSVAARIRRAIEEESSGSPSVPA
ncbi:MAG: hypothetical protein FJ291_15675 [Planctomycetes bacterium]|nr:hypothetical protein [Planctomycetota bacterium]